MSPHSVRNSPVKKERERLRGTSRFVLPILRKASMYYNLKLFSPYSGACKTSFCAQKILKYSNSRFHMRKHEVNLFRPQGTAS